MALYDDQEKYNFNVVNILKPMTASSGNRVIDLYSTGSVLPHLQAMGVRYSGFITYLMASITIRSLPETSIPPIPESALPEEVRKILEEVATLTQFKRMSFWVRFAGENPTFICSIPIFGRSPFYNISLMPFFSGTNNTTDIGHSRDGRPVTLSISVDPPLGASDNIAIWGSAIERISAVAPPPQEKQSYIRYQSWQFNVTTNESLVLTSNINRNNATFVNRTVIPVGGNWEDYTIWIRKDGGLGIPLLPQGSSYQISKNSNYWQGAVFARSNLATQLSVEEGAEL